MIFDMIKVDEEFKSLIPPLTDEEYRGLEEKILKEGCRDAIVTWYDTIIDGHNRYEICNRLNVPFQTIPINIQLEDKEDVKIWIIKNQLARRNLNKFVRTELLLKFEGIWQMKAKARQSAGGGDKKSESYKKSVFPNSGNPISTDKKSGFVDLDRHFAEKEDFTPIDTEEEIANRAKVSHDTVWKVKKIKEKASEHINILKRLKPDEYIFPIIR